MKNWLSKTLRLNQQIPTIPYFPQWGVMIVDILICSVAFYISQLVGKETFNYVINPQFQLDLRTQYIIFMLVQIFYMLIFNTSKAILRYSTFSDILRIVYAVIATGLTLWLTNLLAGALFHYKPFFNTMIYMYMPISFCLAFLLRMFIKTLYEATEQLKGGSPKVLIYGTKSAGIAISKMLRSAGNVPYRPVGFISDNPNEFHDMAGMHVYPLNEDLIAWMKRHDVQHVIVSPIKMHEIQPATGLNIFIENNIKVLTTPYFTQYENAVDGDYQQRIGRINTIQIEDLLERPEINISTENVRQIITDKVVLISGAAGSIGSELVRQVQKYDPKITILLEQAESPLHDLTLDLKKQFPNANFLPIIADIRNRDNLQHIFEDTHPNIVYHAAAYKHVPLMEQHPNEAIRANVMGTKNMADMAVRYGVERFVMISTDKAVNPTNIMGASKRIAEIYVQSLFKKLEKETPNCTKFITTRFGNVLGSNGSVIPYFKKQIAEGGPVTVTHPDIIRYFMTIPEACCLVMEASTLGHGGEIFVFDMGRPVKILDLAKNMIRLAGYIPDQEIKIEFTGLRPGEKLYEELLNQKETTLPTTNEKIMRAKVREFNFDEVEVHINELIALGHQDKPFMSVQKMKEIVPEFKSKNSIYEQLDK